MFSHMFSQKPSASDAEKQDILETQEQEKQGNIALKDVENMLNVYQTNKGLSRKIGNYCTFFGIMPDKSPFIEALSNFLNTRYPKDKAKTALYFTKEETIELIILLEEWKLKLTDKKNLSYLIRETLANKAYLTDTGREYWNKPQLSIDTSSKSYSDGKFDPDSEGFGWPDTSLDSDMWADSPAKTSTEESKPAHDSPASNNALADEPSPHLDTPHILRRYSRS